MIVAAVALASCVLALPSSAEVSRAVGMSQGADASSNGLPASAEIGASAVVGPTENGLEESLEPDDHEAAVVLSAVSFAKTERPQPMARLAESRAIEPAAPVPLPRLG